MPAIAQPITECEHTDKRHHARGMCRNCYENWRNRTEERKRARKDSYYEGRYNISKALYLEMLEVQEGVCGYCGGTNKNGKPLSVDHDHSCCPGRESCGKCIRGLLCHTCNVSLGSMEYAMRKFGNVRN